MLKREIKKDSTKSVKSRNALRLQKEFLKVSINYLNRVPWKEINFPEFSKDIGLLVKGSTKSSVASVVYLLVMVSIEILKLHILTCDKNSSQNIKECNCLIDEGVKISKHYLKFKNIIL